MFQVFQLTELVIRGPVSRGKKFIVTLDRVAIKEEETRDNLLCVQALFGDRASHREVSSQSPA